MTIDRLPQEERERLMDLDIDQKIIQSKKIIRATLDKFGPERLAIAWTGGKDSTLMLWLCCQVCNELSMPIPRCMVKLHSVAASASGGVRNMYPAAW